jgi:hypothetical protein
MKVLVIPDIHLKGWVFDRAEEILRSGMADCAVCLMDIPDDWDKGMNIKLYSETFDRAIKFAKAFPDTLWCYGNHDISYPWGVLETGYSPYAENTVIFKLNELTAVIQDPTLLKFIHRIDNVIFSHGGLIEDYVRGINEELLDADIDEVLTAVNESPRRYLWNDDSPLWHRPQHRKTEAFRRDTYTQVVGHTPVDHIYEENGFISTDVFSTYRDGRQIGESAMIVIDSISGEYEKIEVAGGNS